MRIANASSALGHVAHQEVTGAIASESTVRVPAATEGELPAFQSFLSSAAGRDFLLQLRSPALAQHPILTLDPASQAVFKDALKKALTTLPTLTATGSVPTAGAPRPSAQTGSWPLTGIPLGNSAPGLARVAPTLSSDPNIARAFAGGTVCGASVAAITELVGGADQTGAAKMLVTLLGGVIGGTVLAMVAGKVIPSVETTFHPDFSLSLKFGG